MSELELRHIPRVEYQRENGRQYFWIGRGSSAAGAVACRRAGRAGSSGEDRTQSSGAGYSPCCLQRRACGRWTAAESSRDTSPCPVWCTTAELLSAIQSSPACVWHQSTWLSHRCRPHTSATLHKRTSAQRRATHLTAHTFKNQQLLTALYPEEPVKPAPELSETLTQYTTLIVLKFLISSPNLPSQASSLPRWSNTRQNLGKLIILT